MKLFKPRGSAEVVCMGVGGVTRDANERKHCTAYSVLIMQLYKCKHFRRGCPLGDLLPVGKLSSSRTRCSCARQFYCISQQKSVPQMCHPPLTLYPSPRLSLFLPCFVCLPVELCELQLYSFFYWVTHTERCIL